MKDSPFQEYRFVSNHKEIDISLWERFVRKHPSGSIYQLPDMVTLSIKTQGQDALTLFCIHQSGEIVGICVSILLWSGGFFKRWITSRSVITGGPLISVEHEKITGLFLEKLVEIHPAETIYIQVRNLCPQKHLLKYFEFSKFHYNEHLNFIIDLKTGEDELWMGLHPTRRKQIRRALKRGVITSVQSEISSELIIVCYSILKAVYNRIKLPLPDLSFFEEANRLFGPSASMQCITASVDNRIIGFRFVLIYNNVIYDWFAGSDPNYKDKYPNDLTSWMIMKWGINKVLSSFDFGGAGSPDEKYGVRDFKEKFGGSLVNYGRFLRIKRPLIFFSGKTALKVLNKMTS